MKISTAIVTKQLPASILTSSIYTVMFCMILTMSCFAQVQQPKDVSVSQHKPSVLQKEHSKNFFVKNKGQWNSKAQYLAKLGNARAWITSNGIVYDYYTVHSPSSSEPLRERETTEQVIKRLKNTNINGHVVAMAFEGASASPVQHGNNQKSGIYNYLMGNDASKWISNVPLYGEVYSKDVYPGIDVRYYYEEKNIRYDFILSPGSNPAQIALRFSGQDKVELSNLGELLIGTSLGEIKHHKLFAYQVVNSAKLQVACEFFVRENGSIGLSLGEYDATLPLIIDPVIYSTYLGGSGSDDTQGMTVDASGNAYIFSATSSGNFPSTPGAYRITPYLNQDMAVTKLSATGALVYSTYLGGSNFDFPRAIALDASNNAYLTGGTLSADYPTTAGCYDNSFDAGFGATTDAFVTKLNTTGTALVYSTYLGANGSEEGQGIVVNASGEAYVGGFELKFGSVRHPVTASAYNVGTDVTDGFSSVFVTKFNAAGSGLVYSAVWGSQDTTDNFGGIALDNAGNATVFGNTRGFTYPTTAGVYQQSKNNNPPNNRDVFVTKLNSTGTGVLLSTFIGGSRNDNATGGIAVDASNNIYIVGETTLDTTNTANYPTTAGAFRTAINRPVGDYTLYTDMFVTKLNSTASALVYSTFLGTDSSDQAHGMSIDASGNVAVVGLTNDGNYPVTANAIQATPGGFGSGSGAFWEHVITTLNSTGTALQFSSYSGGNGQETGSGGVAIDAAGNITFAMSTASSNYPTSAGAFQTAQPGGGSDGVVVCLSTVQSQQGSALAFDGVNDGVYIANNAIINGAQASRTMEAWFKVTNKSIGTRKQMIFEYGGPTRGINMYVFNGSLYMGAYDFSQGWSGNWISTSAINSGQFHHAAIAFDGPNNRIIGYLDDVELDRITIGIPSVITPSTDSNGIGDINGAAVLHDGTVNPGNGTANFGGVIDEIRLWNGAHNCGEITGYRNCELAGTESGLAVYYKFNQGVANGNNTGVTTLDDETANNIDGTLLNFDLSNGNSTSNWTTPGAVTTGNSCPTTIVYPEINLVGNGNNIVSGSTATSTSNATDLGTASICSGTLSRSYAIQNLGTSPLILTNAAPNYVTLSGSSAFTVSTQPSGSTINPSSNLVFTVMFTPLTIGTHTTTVTIPNTDCNESPYNFVIGGTGSNVFTYGLTGNWDVVKNWFPSYPGINLPELCSIIIDGNITIRSPLSVTTNATFTINNGRSLTIAAGSNFMIPATTAGTFTNYGTLNIAGTFAVNGNDVYSPGTINVTGGTVRGTGTITTPTLTIPAGSFLAPGASPGCLTITGNTNITGTLQIEIAGPVVCTQYDQQIVTGTATITGSTLDLTNYTATPAAANTYTILTAGAVAGTFNNILYPTLPGYCQNVAYNPTSVVYTVHAQPNPTFSAFPSPVCSGGGSPDYTYTYTVNPGTIGTSFSYAWNIPVNATVTAGSISSNSVTLRFTSGTSANLACTVTRTDVTPACATTINQSVNINASPIAYILYTSSPCPSLPSWTKMQTITLNQSGTSINDYRLLLTVNTQTLIASGDLRSDGGDLRFTVGCTQIPYWIESGLNTTTTKIWVKVPTVAVGANEIKMFYGNPSTSFASPNTASNVFETGVISLFTFTEGAGAVLNDRVGGFNLNITGGVTWSAGFRPGVSSLTGFNGGRAFLASSGPALGAGSFTAIDFMNATNPNGSTQGIVGNYNNDGASGWVHKLQGSPGQEMLLTNQGGNWCQSSVGAIPANQWVMAGVRRNAGVTNSAFVNGISAGNFCAGDNRNVNNANGPFEIGRSYNNSYPFSGNISMVAIYNRALSDAEVLALTLGINPAQHPTVSMGTVSTITNSSSICLGSNATVNLSGSESNINYQLYQDGNPIQSPKPGTGLQLIWTVSGLAVGNYTYTAIATNTINGCVNQMNGNPGVIVNAQPNPTFSAFPTPVCVGGGVPINSYTYTVNPGSIGSGFTYAWTVPVTATVVSGSTNSASITVRFNVVQAETLYCAVTRTDVIPSCATQISGIVTVNPIPGMFIQGRQAVCTGTETNYTTSSAPNQTYQWSISPIHAFVQTGNSITVDWGNANTYTITCTATNTITGCSNTQSGYTVVVSNNPNPTIVGSTSGCAGQTSTYNVTPVSGTSTYVWSVQGGTYTGSGSSITVTWTSSGANSVSVTEIAGTTCSTTVRLGVSVSASPTPVISGTTSACTGTAISYSTPSVSGNSYLWTATGGGSIVGTSTSPTVQIQFTSATACTLSVREISGGVPACTTQTSPYMITVTQMPNPVITGSATGCTGTPSTYSTPFVTGNTYSWNVTGGTILSGATNNSMQVQWSTSGPKSVTITETNGSCSKQTQPMNVTVTQTPAPSIQGSTVACINDQVSFGVPPVTGATYNWTIAGGTILSGSTTTTVTVEFTQLTSTTLGVTVTLNGCIGTDNKAITVNAKPNPVISSTSGGLAVVGVCATSTHTYSTPNNAGSGYTWSVTGGNVVSGAGTSSISVQWINTGSGSVTVREVNAQQCTTSVTSAITVNALPTPSVSGASNACTGASQTYSTANVVGNTYVWTVKLNGNAVAFTQTNNQISVSWSGSGTGEVSVIETNPNTSCSKQSGSVFTVVTQTPSPSITGANSTCINTSTVYSIPAISGATYQWSATGGIIVNGASTTQGTVQFTQTTGTSVMVVVTVSGCMGSGSKTVTINPNPTPSITSSTNGLATVGVCAGSTHSYSTPNNAGSSYVWTVTGGTITSGAGTSSVQVQWNTAGTGSIRVRETNAAGCSAETTPTNIVINGLPTPSVSGSSNACTGVSQMYSTANVAGNTYAWTVKLNGNAVAFTQTNNQISVTWSASGTGEVSVMETNPTTNCSKQSGSVFTVVTQTPTPSITGATSTCAGTTRTYSTSNVAGNSYTWTVLPSGTSFTGQGTNSISVTWGSASGSVQVFERASGNTSCVTTTAAYGVTVNPLPTPGITGAATACASSTIITNYIVTTVNGSSTYTWQAAGGVISGASTGTSVNIIWNTVGSQIVRLTETTSASCTKYIDKSVQVNSVLVPTITGSTTSCAGETKQYTVTNVHTGSTYGWSVTNGTIQGSSSSTVVQVLWNTVGSGSVSVTETSQGCIGMSTPINVTVNALPTPTVTSSTNGLATAGVCAGSTHTYSTPNNAGSSYVWTVTGGMPINGITGASISVLWNTAGAGSIRVRETNSNNCSTLTAVQTITVNALPTPSVSGNTSACTGVSQTYSTALVTGNNYTWTVKLNGNAVGFAQTNNQISVTWGASGTGEVSVMETNPTTNCSNQSASVFTVVTTTPTPSITGATSTCAGTTRTYSTTNVAGNSYTWTVLPSGTSFTGQGTNSIMVTWGTTSGSVSVTEVASGNTNCVTSTTPYAVVVNPLPTPGITGAGSACVSTTTLTNYTVTTPTSGSTYVWAVAGGVFSGASSGTSVNVIWNASGSNTISVTETTSANCSGSTQRTITVNPTPQPVVNGVLVVCAGKTETYTLQQPSTNSTYSWNVLGGAVQGSTTGVTVTVQWNTVGSGSVSVTETALGCSGTSATRTITINAVPTPSITSSTGGLATVGVCAGTIHTYSTQNNIGSTYNWTVTGGVIQSGATSATTTVLWNSTSGSIRVRETNAVSCTTETAPIAITINPVPTPTVTGAPTACTGTTTTYSTAFSSGRTYVWTVTQGGSPVSFTTGANAATITVQWSAAGSAQVSVVETIPATGCSTTSNVYNTTINPLPTPSIIGNATVCTGVSTTYTTASSSNRTYAWTVTPSSATVTGQGTNSIMVTFTQSGTGSIMLTETNTQTGCSASATPRSITVGLTPSPVISGASSVCNTSTTSYSVANNAGSSYNWTVSGGTVTSGAGTSTIQVLWNTVGQQSVNVTETNNGCTGIAQTFSVTVNLQPSPVVSGVTSICAGFTSIYTTPQIGGASYMWTVTGGTLATSNGVHEVGILWSSAGAGTVRVMVTTIPGCSATSPLHNVTINPNPTPSITSSTNGIPNVCVSSTHTYSTAMNSGSTYNWSLTGAPSGTTLTPSGNSATIVWGATTSTAQLSVMETSGAGCTGTTQTQIVVNPLPNPVITGVSQICSGRTATYGTSGASGNSFTWTVVGGTISQGQGTNVIVVQWGGAGSGSVSVLQTSVVGCSKQSSTFGVTINANPTPTITSTTGGLPAACMQSVQSYQTVNTAGNSYTWSVTNGTIQSGQGSNVIQVKWGNGSGASVTVTEIVNATQCTTTVTTQVSLNPLPTPAVNGNRTVCTGTTTTYTTPPSANSSFVWTVTGGTFTNTGNQITVTWGAAGTGRVVVTETITTTGCSVKDSIATITIVGLPTPAISGLNTACTGATSTASTGNQFVWSVTGGSVYNGQGSPTAQIQWSSAGMQTITLTERNTALGCEATTTFPVTVRNVAPPTITGLIIGCVGQTSTYTVTNNAGSTYNWSVTSGTVEQGQGSNTIVVRWGNNTAGTLRVTETNNGCTGQSLPFDVQIVNVPQTTITGNATGCQNTRANYSVPFAIGVNYAWTVTGGTISQGQGTNNLEVLWGAGAQGVVQLSVSSPLSACTTQALLNVTLFARTTPTVSVMGNSAICEGESVVLAAPQGFASYYWNSTGESSSSINVDRTGSYSVTVTSVNGCVSTSLPVTISVLPKPNATVTASGPLQFCQGGSVTLTAANGAQSYRWSTGATTQAISATIGGTYFVTVTGNNGCKATSAEISVVVTNAPKPLISTNGPTTFCEGIAVTLDAGAGYQSYAWSTGATTRTISVTQSGSYSVIGTLSAGCVGTSDPITVTVNNKPAATITAAGPTTFCDGGSVALSAPSGMTSYEWSNGATSQSITVSASGSFTVKVTNSGGCSAVSTPTVVTVNPLPAKPVITTVNNQLSSSVAAGYQWILGASDITGANQQVYTPTANGTYKVRVRNNNGCENTSDGIVFTVSSVIEDGDVAGLIVKPNPATDNITFSIANDREEDVKFTILTVTGNEVLRVNTGKQSGMIVQTVNVSDIASGVYTLRVSIGNRIIATTFVIHK